VKRILNAASEIPIFHPQDFIYRKFNLADEPSEKLSDVLEQAVEFIRKRISLFLTLKIKGL
jgi:hypothetical protein